MPIETVKGFRDVLFPESLKRRKIREIIEKNFKIFGFMPIETPSVEYDELVAGDNEKDEAVSDRFKLKDRGQRNLALRYEFTFQLKRIFKENQNIRLPFRRYQIGSIFRDEPIERDRYREFTQCDADIIGDSSVMADAECLALADKICKELGIKYVLKVNNRTLLNSILEKLEIGSKADVLRELDKMSKVGEDEVKKNLTKYADKIQILELFKLLNKNLSYFVAENFAGAKEVSELVKMLKKYDVKAEFSPFLLRGFAYYTGNIFEGFNDKIKGSIFGGGRYDDLVGEYINRKIPAVGISLGRILDYPGISVDFVKCILISIGQDAKTAELLGKLREKQIPCFAMDKVSKALEFANSSNTPYVVFIGSDEVKKKKYKLRNMKTGKEEMLAEKNIILRVAS